MTKTLARKQVRAGIALLTKVEGPDFRERLDLDKLNVASAQSCVLGQLYGNHAVGCQKLGFSITDESNGFYSDKLSEYSKLTEIWKEELLARSA